MKETNPGYIHDKHLDKDGRYTFLTVRGKEHLWIEFNDLAEIVDKIQNLHRCDYQHTPDSRVEQNDWSDENIFRALSVHFTLCNMGGLPSLEQQPENGELLRHVAKTG